MGGLLIVESVTGTSPDWNLTVNSSVGAQIDDMVLCGLAGGLGGIFRVTAVPDTTSISVRDDIGPYGQPVPGEGSYYTPVGFLHLSQVVKGAKKWDAAHRLDFQKVGLAVRGVVELLNPVSILAEDVGLYKVIVITNTTPAATVTIEDLTTGEAGLTVLVVNALASTENLTVAPVTILLSPGTAKPLVWDGASWLSI